MTRARQFFEFVFGEVRDPWSWLFVTFVVSVCALDWTGHKVAAWLVAGVELVTIVVLRATKTNGTES